jgi:hypothetical protein
MGAERRSSGFLKGSLGSAICKDEQWEARQAKILAQKCRENKSDIQ